MDKELVKGSTTTMILSLLATEPMYGYQMTKALEERSNQVFTLKEGTLYPLLHTLENNGIITSFWDDTSGLRKRKYYQITEIGRKLLAEKQQEWQIFSEAVNKVIGGVRLEYEYKNIFRPCL